MSNLEASSNTAIYLKAFAAMDEDDFTKTVLKPLFEKMGCHRVDFHGGRPYEEGKDLIARFSSPLMDKEQVIFIQAKKIGNAQKVTDAAKYTQLAHQLRQCQTKGIETTEGTTIMPTQVRLACPEQLNSRFVKEISSQLNIEPKVQCYDGPKIIKDLKEYYPELLNSLLNMSNKLSVIESTSLNNHELFSALHCYDNFNFVDCYSDLSFFVGSIDSNFLFSMEIRKKSNVLEIASEDWRTIKNQIVSFSACYKVPIKNAINKAESEYSVKFSKFNSKENEQKIAELNTLRVGLNKLSKTILQDIEVLQQKLKEINKYKSLDDKSRMSVEKIDSVKEKCDAVRSTFSTNSTNIQSYEDNLELVSQLRAILASSKEDKVIQRIDKQLTGLHKKIGKLKDLLIKSDSLELIVYPRPTYRVEFEIEKIYDFINELKDSYFDSVKKINGKGFSQVKLKRFLADTKKTLSILAEIHSKSSFFRKLLTFEFNDRIIQARVAISPHDIFATGNDIALYGGAGVGKTTTLQMYARDFQCTDFSLLLYLPVNRLLSKYLEIDKPSIDHLDIVLSLILISKKLPCDIDNLEELKNVLPQKHITLILDGIDEVYDKIPNLLDSITKFKKDFTRSQVIISSRDCVSYLSEIDFLGITLLPFTDQQMTKFVYGWFQNERKAQNLIDTIYNRKMFDSLRTPLLLTIMCSLVKSGVKAPSSENAIYSERIELLTGKYDNHKKVERQTQKGELLKVVAIKLAYRMHRWMTRSLSKQKMLEFLFDDLSQIYDKRLIRKCLKELIDPCNLLIRDPLNSTYSFGHFRFQEHLASLELKSNRSIDLAELITNDWWRGAFVLYAQENDFSYIFEDIFTQNENFNAALMTLESMVEASPSKIKNDLKYLLEQYKETDAMDYDLLNGGSFYENSCEDLDLKYI